MLRRTPPLNAATRAAFGRIIELVGPLLASVAGVERRLASPVQGALEFCDGLVAALPGPIEINRRAFAIDPLVHAFFSTALDIDEMLGRSQTLRDFLANPEFPAGEHFHALFAARRREKRVMGLALQGEMLRREVPQDLLYFSSHTLTAVAADPQTTCHMLRIAAFESLLNSFVARVDAIRLERQSLHAERDVERAQSRERHTNGAVSAEHRGKLADLDARILGLTESLQPDLLVDALAALLLEPDKWLRLEPVKVRVDRNGVIADALHDPDGQDGSLSFPELVGRDRRRYVVMLARIPRNEAERAVANILDRQRRFIVI